MSMIPQEMSKIQQADFLSKHQLTSADFKAANLNYEELLNISSDFESKRAAYDEIGNGVVKILFKFNGVHAIRYQINTSEELMYKLAAYQLENPAVHIDLTNYEALIDDLISIRIIPLFKSDWAKIHESILDQFVVFDKITANFRQEDTAAVHQEFTDKGVELKIQPDGYRSIDYVIKTAPSKKEYKAAVQIRSIFEEGWAAIDHYARNQEKMDNQILNDFSKTLNKLAGGAEEIGECIHGLKAQLNEKDLLIQEQQALVLEQQQQLEELKAQLAQVNLDKKENISADILGKSIIEDLAKTAAHVSGGSVPVAIHSSQPEVQTEEAPIEAKQEQMESEQIQAVTVQAETKSKTVEKSIEEKPKTIKNSSDSPKATKLKEEKIKLEKPKEEKQKLETVLPLEEDLFGQMRIPDAPPLKPSNTNA
ncbi:RelA/SpoT domain-containing protein [Pedobacter gandavensis]|uniref:RelA/SpoT domain-containing protein n=1 Tax=Pedobacter TaxID=84567 RepID=UPI001C999DB9|nr:MULTISPECIES: RelA/SpoT domain-containing protein [Pedobacter]WGQ10404.1 RelA/SpoT domain-containing protein [Pedobacter gandavensis]